MNQQDEDDNLSCDAAVARENYTGQGGDYTATQLCQYRNSTVMIHNNNNNYNITWWVCHSWPMPAVAADLDSDWLTFGCYIILNRGAEKEGTRSFPQACEAQHFPVFNSSLQFCDLLLLTTWDLNERVGFLKGKYFPLVKCKLCWNAFIFTALLIDSCPTNISGLHFCVSYQICKCR